MIFKLVSQQFVLGPLLAGPLTSAPWGLKVGVGCLVGHNISHLFSAAVVLQRKTEKKEEKQAERKMLQQKGSPDRSDMKYGI